MPTQKQTLLKEIIRSVELMEHADLQRLSAFIEGMEQTEPRPESKEGQSDCKV
jgi:hypothetical protein